MTGPLWSAHLQRLPAASSGRTKRPSKSICGSFHSSHQSPFGKHFLYVTKAQWQAKAEPDGPLGGRSSSLHQIRTEYTILRKNRLAPSGGGEDASPVNNGFREEEPLKIGTRVTLGGARPDTCQCLSIWSDK